MNLYLFSISNSEEIKSSFNEFISKIDLNQINENLLKKDLFYIAFDLCVKNLQIAYDICKRMHISENNANREIKEKISNFVNYYLIENKILNK